MRSAQPLYGSQPTQRTTALLGISAVTLFCGALATFALLNSEFHPLESYVSELGARGQPHALWWNLTGFLAVGIALAGFGWNYGRVIRDRPAGILFALFGLGFCTTAVPVETGDGASQLTKAHTVAICLGLAAWTGGLARMTTLGSLDKPVKRTANIAALLLVLPMFFHVAGWVSMPVTHRLVFAVVFGWVLLTSVHLLRNDDRPWRHETSLQ